MYVIDIPRMLSPSASVICKVTETYEIQITFVNTWRIIPSTALRSFPYYYLIVTLTQC